MGHFTINHILIFYLFRKLNIDKNLIWSLENSGLTANDSILVVGQTIQLKLMRSFQIGSKLVSGSEGSNMIQIALSWTPLRKLVWFDDELTSCDAQGN